MNGKLSRLGPGHLFNEQTTCGHISSVCVSISVPLTVSYIETNTHVTFVDLVTVTFNMADAVDILGLSLPHVQCTVNGSWGRALSTIESKEPSFTATITFIDPENSVPVDMEDGVAEFLLEKAILGKKR